MEMFDARPNSTTMAVINYVFILSLLLALLNLKLTAAHCRGRCEQSTGRIRQTGTKNRAMEGHSFKNVSLSQAYDCHVKCFDEKCRCQAYQICGNRCELLDEDRFTAPDDFVDKEGYTYFDMNKEYVSRVRDLYVKNFNFSLLKIELRFQSSLG